MHLKLLYKKHFCDILILLERAPMSFNELEKTVGAYSDTLNKRLKEMLQYDLVELTVDVVGGKNRIKHRLTGKGDKLMPQVKEFAKCGEELELGTFS
jgi:DNA-binding HxlR family transcriptional regulator